MRPETIHCLANAPAGYDLADAILHTGDTILSMKWLVPGAGPVYCHAVVATPEDIVQESFWDAVIVRVVHHVRGRFLKLHSATRGVSTYKDMALSDNPPATETTNVIHPPAPPDPAARSFAGVPTETAGEYDLAPLGKSG